MAWRCGAGRINMTLHDIPKDLLMQQINKQFENAFGISVTDMAADKRTDDWHAMDFEQQDLAVKREIYDLICKLFRQE
jgi:predicted mannosyl-3-phosphoglycerate phosphatase (HAD superfamily)